MATHPTSGSRDGPAQTRTAAKADIAGQLMLVLSLAVVGTCLGVWAWFLAVYGVDVPRLDQFYTPAFQIKADGAGELDLALLVKQHNESRKLLPNLISIAFYRLRGFWDLRVELLFGWSICVLIVGAIGRLAWVTTRDTLSTAVLTAWFTGLLWSSHTLYFHFLSITFERSLPQLILLLILIMFIQYGIRWTTVVAAGVGCAASQYSYASGIVIWPLCITCIILSEPHSVRANSRKIGMLVLCAALSSWFYFDDYSRPGNHTALTDIFSMPFADMCIYLLRFFGNGLTSSHLSRAAAIGGVFLVAYLILAGRFLWSSEDQESRQARSAWVIVGLYSLAQAVLSMIGRLPMGIDNAARGDYVTHPLYLFVSVFALAMITLGVRQRKIAEVVALIGAIGLAWTAVKPVTWKEVRRLNLELEYGRSCFLLSGFFEEPECLMKLDPWHGGRSQFMAEISPHLRRPILERVVVGGEADSSEVSWDASGDPLVVSGRASVLGEPANAVVVQDALEGEFVAIEPVGVPRPESLRDGNGRIDPAGWVIYLAAETAVQPCDLRIYAMDNDTGVLHPIPDATKPGCVAGTSEPPVEPGSG